MKKYLFFVSILMLGFALSHAQSFEKGQLSISPGINVGGLGFYGGGSGLPLVLSGEYGINDFIGVGPFVGFARYSYGFTGSQYSWTFLSFGARADFHFWEMLEEALEAELGSEKFDVYAAVLLGFRTANFSNTDGVSPGFGFGSYGNGGIFAITVGGRYYITNKLAVFAEAGRSLYGALNLGITLKLK